MNRIKPVFVMVLSNRKFSENFELPPSAKADLSQWHPPLRTGNPEKSMFTANVHGPNVPRGPTPQAATRADRPRLLVIHTESGPAQTQPSSGSASSYSRSKFLPSGLKLVATVIRCFFLFTLYTLFSSPIMGPDTARIRLPGRKATRETSKYSPWLMKSLSSSRASPSMAWGRSLVGRRL